MGVIARTLVLVLLMVGCKPSDSRTVTKDDDLFGSIPVREYVKREAIEKIPAMVEDVIGLRKELAEKYAPKLQATGKFDGLSNRELSKFGDYVKYIEDVINKLPKDKWKHHDFELLSQRTAVAFFAFSGTPLPDIKQPKPGEQPPQLLKWSEAAEMFANSMILVELKHGNLSPDKICALPEIQRLWDLVSSFGDVEVSLAGDSSEERANAMFKKETNFNYMFGPVVKPVASATPDFLSDGQKQALLGKFFVEGDQRNNLYILAGKPTDKENKPIMPPIMEIDDSGAKFRNPIAQLKNRNAVFRYLVDHGEAIHRNLDEYMISNGGELVSNWNKSQFAQLGETRRLRQGFLSMILASLLPRFAAAYNQGMWATVSGGNVGYNADRHLLYLITDRPHLLKEASTLETGVCFTQAKYPGFHGLAEIEEWVLWVSNECTPGILLRPDRRIALGIAQYSKGGATYKSPQMWREGKREIRVGTMKIQAEGTMLTSFCGSNNDYEQKCRLVFDKETKKISIQFPEAEQQ